MLDPGSPEMKDGKAETEPSQLSPAETRLLQTLLDRLGYRRYGMSRMLFDESYLLLGEASNAYDASAFLASCAMSRAALEGALNTFATSRRMPGTDTAWQVIVVRNKRGEVHTAKMGELVSQVIREGGLAEQDRETVDRIIHDGDLALHLVQKHYSGLVDYSEDLKAARLPARPKWWPMESDAKENISATIDIIAALLNAMRIGPAPTSRNEAPEEGKP
jgi:hypothetical protein